MLAFSHHSNLAFAMCRANATLRIYRCQRSAYTLVYCTSTPKIIITSKCDKSILYAPNCKLWFHIRILNSCSCLFQSNFPWIIIAITFVIIEKLIYQKQYSARVYRVFCRVTILCDMSWIGSRIVSVQVNCLRNGLIVIAILWMWLIVSAQVTKVPKFKYIIPTYILRADVVGWDRE